MVSCFPIPEDAGIIFQIQISGRWITQQDRMWWEGEEVALHIFSVLHCLDIVHNCPTLEHQVNFEISFTYSLDTIKAEQFTVEYTWVIFFRCIVQIQAPTMMEPQDDQIVSPPTVLMHPPSLTVSGINDLIIVLLWAALKYYLPNTSSRIIEQMYEKRTNIQIY